MNDNPSTWKRVAIRKDLLETVEDVIAERPDLGYNSPTRFVEDAVRRRVEETRT